MKKTNKKEYCEFRIKEHDKYYCQQEISINPKGDCECINCIERDDINNDRPNKKGFIGNGRFA